MASVAHGGGDAPRWVGYVQPAVNAILVAIIFGLVGTFLVANSAASGVFDHERRIEALESSPARISVLESKADAQAEQSRRIEDKIDRLMEMQQRKGSRND